jgi:hypothetical protein
MSYSRRMTSLSRSRPARATRRKTRWRLLRAMLGAPLWLQMILGAATILIVWALVNWTYQTIRKPSQLFVAMSSSLVKSPLGTWQSYGSLFRKHSTPVITSELLAALAQIEGGGNPVAQTYWRWRLTWNPFELYQPASSAVGMYQITDAAFREAKRYCIHDHVVVDDGPWHDAKSCWFNSLYTRVVPSHAIELTAALLDRGVANVLGRQRTAATTLQQKQDLAAVIHLCGSAAGEAYAKRGFRVLARQKCGDHPVRDYLAQLNAMKRQFARLAAAS